MNILTPMYNKQRISFKEAVDSFQGHESWKFAVRIGYCDLESFIGILGSLSGVSLSPFAYSASNTYGWRCDYYNIPRRIVLQQDGSVLISQEYFILATGYAAPSSFKSPADYKKVKELNNLAKSAREVIYKEEKPTIEMKQLYINELLLGFADLVANAHGGK